jgi:hypothetical protein
MTFSGFSPVHARRVASGTNRDCQRACWPAQKAHHQDRPPSTMHSLLCSSLSDRRRRRGLPCNARRRHRLCDPGHIQALLGELGSPRGLRSGGVGNPRARSHGRQTSSNPRIQRKKLSRDNSWHRKSRQDARGPGGAIPEVRVLVHSTEPADTHSLTRVLHHVHFTWPQHQLP